MFFIKLTFILTIISIYSFSYAQSAKALPKVIWEREFGNEEFFYQYKASAITRNGDILIASISYKNKDNKSNSLWLWRISKNGELIDEFKLKKPKKDSRGRPLDTRHSDIKGLVTIEEDVLLIIEYVQNNPWIVRINKNGNQVMANKIGKPARRFSTTKILPTKDNNFLLLGHESYDALAIKIDIKGNILWEEKKNLGKMDFFVDGVSTKDGGFILVGNSGMYNMLRQGPSNIWVFIYDANRKLISEKSFSGRFGSVVNFSKSGYAIVYDKDNSESQNIWVKFLSHDSKELWKYQILVEKRGLSNFKLVSTSDGSLLVVGARNIKPYIAKINQKGELLWEFYDEISTVTMKHDILYFKDEFFVICLIFSKNKKNLLREKIRIAKYLQK